jgi:hypothetical protein
MALAILSDKAALNCKQKLKFLNRIDIKSYAEYTIFLWCVVICDKYKP